MKYLILIFLLLITSVTHAQKYALLDEHFNHRVRYADTITFSDKRNGFFPVEKKLLPQFLKTLEEIEKKLSSKTLVNSVQNYQIDCITFSGAVVSSGGTERIDYVITSTCGTDPISMHLSDAKKTKASNAFFVKVWIRYIQQGLK